MKKVSLVGWSCFVLMTLFSVACSTPRPYRNAHAGLLDEKSEVSEENRANLEAGVNVRKRRGWSAALLKNGPTEAEDLNGFRWPLRHVSVTSPFGQRGRWVHEGVDLRARSGTPVFSAQSGTVIYAGTKIRGYGRLIVIRHPGNVATIYAHNSKLLVRRGQQVKKGDQIALSGNTGRSSGPHLHFEVRRGMDAVDPLGILPRLANYTPPPSKTPVRKRNRGLPPAAILATAR